MASSGSPSFTIWDYAVFIVFLIVSAVVGIIPAITGGRQQTTEEVFLGNRRMNPVSVGLSITVTFVSALFIIGSPVETYLFDTMTIWFSICHAISCFFVVRLFFPVLIQLRITSVYEVSLAEFLINLEISQ